MAAAGTYRTSDGAPETNDTRDTLFLPGGMSLFLFGAGLVVTNRVVRKLPGEANMGGLLQAALPDLQRYMKTRSM